MGQKGFWDWEERHEKLLEKKSTLEHLNAIIPWEEFRPLLDKVYQKPRKSNAGRKPFDVILMFKILILQHLHNISDDALEYQINDRLSFMQFLNLGLEDTIPDARTVWLFRERLKGSDLTRELFEHFDDYLLEQGYQAKSGQIVDATLIPVPIQRNTREENKLLKKDTVPEEWKSKPRKLCQKDVEAKWTKKNGRSYFGYKNHISIDAEYGFIRDYEVTTASVHDSKVLGKILDMDNEADEVWGDSAYRSEDIEWVLEKIGFESKIHERSYRNSELTESQVSSNREKSRVRAKVEHVFGHVVMCMRGKQIRSIGLGRAAVNIGLKNLIFNLQRYVFMCKPALA